MINLAIFLFLC